MHRRYRSFVYLTNTDLSNRPCQQQEDISLSFWALQSFFHLLRVNSNELMLLTMEYLLIKHARCSTFVKQFTAKAFYTATHIVN